MPRGYPLLGRCLTTREVALIRQMRADGHTLAAIAEIVGCTAPTIRRYAPGRVGKVPNTALREAFLASPMNADDVARDLGWWNNATGKPDGSRVKRTLGVLPDRNGHGSPAHRRTLVDAETVALIADAIGISPWSVLPDDEDA